MDWQSAALPSCASRPWDNYKLRLGERLEAAVREVERCQAQHDKAMQEMKRKSDHLEAIRSRGALAVFAELDVTEQQEWAEMSIHELSAYVKWRQIPGNDDDAAFEALHCQEKRALVAEDPRAEVALSAWSALVTDGPPPLGEVESEYDSDNAMDAKWEEESEESWVPSESDDDQPAPCRKRLRVKTPPVAAPESDKESQVQPAPCRKRLRLKTSPVAAPGRAPVKTAPVASVADGHAGKGKKGKSRKTSTHVAKWAWGIWGKQLQECELCGKSVTKSNMQRHQRLFCRGS